MDLFILLDGVYLRGLCIYLILSRLEMTFIMDMNTSAIQP
jgi:hypothetical protein